MQLLKDRIRTSGVVEKNGILKVDSFLNHQVDVALLDRIAEEFYRIFSEKNVEKILTVETSGIPLACLTARRFGVPLVIAKKSRSMNIGGEVYSTPVISYTRGVTYDIIVSKTFLGRGERVLLADDFLANGQAITGLIRIADMADAKLVGAAVAVEKGFQGGGDRLRAMGVNLRSLAIIDSITPEGGIIFRDE